jgi:hypothetical protein
MGNKETYERLIIKSKPEYIGSAMFRQATNPTILPEPTGFACLDYLNGVYKENKEKEKIN